MNLIITCLSTFFYNYIIILILGLLRVRNKRKISIIIVSIFNIGEALILGFNMFNDKTYSDQFYYWYYYLTEIGGVLIAYFVTLVILLRGTGIHIKSRRQRQFEREYDESKKKYAILFDILMVLLTILMISLAVLTIVYRSHIKNYYLYLIASIIIGLITISLSIYSITIDLKIKDSNPKIKGLTLFIIKDNNNYKSYIYDGKNGSLEDNLGKISNIYTFTNYGSIKSNDGNYNVLGIAPSNFDSDLYNEIKLFAFDDRFNEVYNEFNRYNKKKIVLDEFNKVVDIKILD